MSNNIQNAGRQRGRYVKIQVMGHSKASKAHTRARLVQTAAARFKERGIDGISVADLMHELALTHGGFYKHFESRDALVAEAVAQALKDTDQTVQKRLFTNDKPDPLGFIKFYLDEAHRSELSSGCAVAALAGDAARKDEGLQRQFREHLERGIATLAHALEGDAAEPRSSALLLLSALYGALLMARATGDCPLSREILRTVRERIPIAAGLKRSMRSAARKPGGRPAPARRNAVP